MIRLSDEELKELFALFTSPAKYELEQIYKPGEHFYKNVNLEEEYTVYLDKRDFALDSWRAVLYFLFKRGFQLKKGNDIIDLDFIEGEFVTD